MKVKEGAMLGNTILSEEEFKEVLMKALSENTEYEKQIVLSLKRMSANINNLPILFKEIEFLQTQLFKNPKTSLLILADLSLGSNNYKQAWDKEEKIIPDTKGQINYQAIKNAVIKKEITQAMSHHLGNLINYVSNTAVPNDFDKIFENSEISIKKDYKSSIGKRLSDPTVVTKTYAYIFYGKKDKNVPGTIADGFLSHLGKKHKDIFNVKEFTFYKNYTFSKEVQEEENTIGFYQLLIDSSNPIGQQTGGDLILLNGNEIIANIQLKTLANLENNSQSISSTDIANSINTMLTFVEKGKIYNKKMVVNLFQDMFKTSGIQHEIAEKIEQSAIDYAKQNLKEISKYSGGKIAMTIT